MEFREIALSEITNDKKELLKHAFKVMKHAYNVYSGFYVGAAVKTKNGNIYTGTNMENASYGLSLCAEIAAIQTAISAGDPEIIMIALTAGSEKTTYDDIVLPCGRCRQIIHECSRIASHDIEIICSNSDMSKLISTNISKLLPMAFNLKANDAEIELYRLRISNK